MTHVIDVEIKRHSFGIGNDVYQNQICHKSGYFVSDLTFYQNKQSDFEDIACTNSEKEQN